MATKSVEPRADNEGSLGSAAYRWATAFIAGVLSNGAESKTIKQIADHIDAAAPHPGHIDATDDPIVLPNETTVPSLVVGDEGEVFLCSDKSVYMIAEEQSNGEYRIAFYDTNRDSNSQLLGYFG